MSLPQFQIDPEEFFWTTAQQHLPPAEVQRRRDIRAVLSAQFRSWRASKQSGVRLGKCEIYQDKRLTFTI
jgi:hypothetical protein